MNAERSPRSEVPILRWFRQDRTVYGCTNCQRTFKSRDERIAHFDDLGVCPQLTWERKNAEHNQAMEMQFFLDEVLSDD